MKKLEKVVLSRDNMRSNLMDAKKWLLAANDIFPIKTDAYRHMLTLNEEGEFILTLLTGNAYFNMELKGHEEKDPVPLLEEVKEQLEAALVLQGVDVPDYVVHPGTTMKQ
jgi:hypothetical protein